MITGNVLSSNKYSRQDLRFLEPLDLSDRGLDLSQVPLLLGRGLQRLKRLLVLLLQAVEFGLERRKNPLRFLFVHVFVGFQVSGLNGQKRQKRKNEDSYRSNRILHKNPVFKHFNGSLFHFKRA